MNQEVIMLASVATPQNRRITLLLSVTAGALVLAGLLVGVSDNPPGILLMALASVAVVVAAVHPWRAPKPFVMLCLASILGFVVLVVLHNLLDGVAGLMPDGNVLRLLVQGVGVAAFLGAILVLPAAVLVGAGGALVMFIRNRWGMKRTPRVA
jgi:integral membrane sensor domain MASE1